MSDNESEPLPAAEVDKDMFRLAAMGNVAQLQTLIDAEGKRDSVDLNARDVFGCTALCWACRNGHLEAATYLVDKGANIESAGFGGFRPLHYAVNYNREAIIQLLVKCGADVNAKDDAGNTPLHWACTKGVLAIVTLLLQAGAAVQSPNAAGATPLHKAVSNGHIGLVNRLVSNGANLVVTDAEGNSVLHYAARCGFGPICKLLIEKGAASSRNKKSQTPAEVAASEAVRKIVATA